MSQQTRIDKILEEVGERAQTEVSALLGASFVLGSPKNTQVTKEGCFGELVEQQVCANLSISGEVEGASCLLIGLKDAILLGGTLIMLPASELEATIAQGNYNEDVEDSYGEIANIIAGSYTKVFEESYPEKCRFVRKEQELLKPAKVDIKSDSPVPDQLYYKTSSAMELDGKSMGELIVLLPAVAFGLSFDEDATEEGSTAELADTKVEESAEGSGGATDETASSPEPAEPSGLSSAESEKNKKRIDLLLTTCFEQLGAELSGLLGVTVGVSDLRQQFVDKEEFFLDVVQGKQVVSDFEMVGDLTGKSYFVVSIKDAIYAGGVLVMLPPSELELVVQEGNFDEDAMDAYGEIANIISGVYSGVFEENYKKKVRFIRRDMCEVAPVKVDISAAEPIPDESYYLSSMLLTINDHTLGRMQLLLPANDFEIIATADDVVEPPVAADSSVGSKTDTASITTPADGSGSTVGTSASSTGSTSGSGIDNTSASSVYDILIISDAPVESDKLTVTLESRGYKVCCIGFADDVFNYIPGRLKAVYLVMNEVNEQAFGIAIKISSGASLPLIAAGPAWTRSTVIKAVKYGVKDILLTPAESTDIAENIDKNIVPLAA